MSRPGAYDTRMQPTFVAIDFETADPGWDSACAVGLVRCEGGEVVRREVRLIRPPRPHIRYTHIHGIRWADVQHQPAFGELSLPSMAAAMSNFSWLKSARGFCRAIFWAGAGLALGADRTSNSLSTKLPLLLRPGPLPGSESSGRTSRRIAVIPFSSVSAVKV